MTPEPDFLHPQRPLFLLPAKIRLPLFALMALCLAGVLYDDYSQFSRREALRDEYQSLRRPTQETKRPNAQAGKDNYLAIERQYAGGWESLFSAVEACRGEDIALLALSGERASRTLTLRGEARNPESLQAFVDALGRQPALGQVFPARQRRLAGTGEGLEFEMRAKWQ